MAKACPAEAVKTPKVRTPRKKRTVKALRETEFVTLYAQLLEGAHDPAAAFDAASAATRGIGQQRRLDLLAAIGLPAPAPSTGERGRPCSEDLDRWEAEYTSVREALLRLDAATYGERVADALASVEMDIARVAWQRAMALVDVPRESARTRLRRAGLVVPTWPRAASDRMPETPPAMQMLAAQLALEAPHLADRRAVRRANESGRARQLVLRWERDYQASVKDATFAQMYGGGLAHSGKIGHRGGRQSAGAAQAHSAAAGQ